MRKNSNQFYLKNLIDDRSWALGRLRASRLNSRISASCRPTGRDGSTFRSWSFNWGKQKICLHIFKDWMTTSIEENTKNRYVNKEKWDWKVLVSIRNVAVNWTAILIDRWWKNYRFETTPFFFFCELNSTGIEGVGAKMMRKPIGFDNVRTKYFLGGIILDIIYHFHLLRVIGIAVIGLNERPTSIEDGRYHQAQWKHVAGSADGRMCLHFRRWLRHSSTPTNE